jgi:hypothetical protein
MHEHQHHPTETIEIVIIEIVEIEEHAKTHGTEAPHARHYAFRVDKNRIVVDTPIITGREILAKDGKTPAAFKLYQHKRQHQPIMIAPDTVVNLREPGVERFTTMPKDTTEGQPDLCSTSDFRLPKADEDYLISLGLPWEAKRHANNCWLVIHDWRLPEGYTQAEWKGRAKRGLHKRSAEAWGHPLRARGAELPLAALAAAFVLVFQQTRGGVAGRTQARRGGWRGPQGRRQGGDFLLRKKGE